MADQIKKEITEDLKDIGDDVASVATHGNVLRTIVPLLRSGRLTNAEIWELTDLMDKIVDRMFKEVEV